MTSRDDLELRLRTALNRSPDDVSHIVRYADFCLDSGIWSTANVLCRRAEQHAPDDPIVTDLRQRVDAARPTVPPLPPDPEIAIQQRIWTHPALRWLRPVKRIGRSRIFYIGFLIMVIGEQFAHLRAAAIGLFCVWFLFTAYLFVTPAVVRRLVRQA